MGIIKLKTISESHELFGLEGPKHPLIAVCKFEDFAPKRNLVGETLVADYYQVSYKECMSGSFQYGRNTYDFQDGTLVFIKPGQVTTIHEWTEERGKAGWSLLFHPDLIRRSELGKNIDKYTFFSYDVHEALHLSDDEKRKMFNLIDDIQDEYTKSIDKHSQKLIVSNIELMLNYCTRFYDRQFYLRENLNKDLISRFEKLLKDYYNSDEPVTNGLPTVRFCGEKLNMSPNYLSDMLKKETGRNALEHIHYHVIEKAKTQLLNTEEAISQIAYGLGFEHPPHFSKLFRKKTGMSPAEFRSLN